MKSKLFLIVTLAALATGVSAQSRWGLRTGLNFDMAGIGLNDALSTSQSIFEGAATE